MGWSYFTEFDKKALVSWLVRNSSSDNSTVINYRVVKNHLWLLLRRHDGTTFLGLDILAGKTGGPDWGYKSVSHRDRNDCPLTFLRELAPAVDENESIWRESVRAYHNRQKRLAQSKRELKPGLNITLYGKEYRLICSLGRRGWCVEELASGTKYRTAAAKVAEALVNQLEIKSA